jgi:Domain of unknown function (DUF4263)
MRSADSPAGRTSVELSRWIFERLRTTVSPRVTSPRSSTRNHRCRATCQMFDWTETVVTSTPGGRKQIKVQIARKAGEVREIQIQKVPSNPQAERMDVLLTLDREDSRKLVEFFRTLEYVPADDGETIRIDDELLGEILRDPEAVDRLYGRNRERIRSLIETDTSADDVVAIAHRHAVVRRFRQLLADEAAFDEAKLECGGRPEAVWQRFLEQNPWILGISLAGQLLTGWNEQRLEQTVAGFTVEKAGKRVDALLRTNGQIRSLVFAEIKHHRTDLLAGTPYRNECWPPSGELAGGVTQIHQTVDRAVHELSERLIQTDDEGMEIGDGAFLVRPRSFLIVGDLASSGPSTAVSTRRSTSPSSCSVAT